MTGPARRPRLAILDDTLRLSQTLADWSGIAEHADIVALDRHVTPDEAAAALTDYDLICTLRERLPFPRALIERLPRLRYLCVTGKRYDTIDIAAAADHGVIVSNTPITGGGTGAVTELTWGLILGIARHIASENRGMRVGAWQTQAGITLRGRRLGIVGLGSIGLDVARIGQAFGMDVVAWSPNLTPERAAAHGIGAVDKATLFGTSDIISLHLALAATTRHVVGDADLRAMRRDAYLVNTARAGLIDTMALHSALRERRIGGAALDVYDVEPLPPADPLRSLDNVLLTPHLGYVTRDMLSIYYRGAAENIAAFLAGTPIRVVTPGKSCGTA